MDVEYAMVLECLDKSLITPSVEGSNLQPEELSGNILGAFDQKSDSVLKRQDVPQCGSSP